MGKNSALARCFLVLRSDDQTGGHGIYHDRPASVNLEKQGRGLNVLPRLENRSPRARDLLGDSKIHETDMGLLHVLLLRKLQDAREHSCKYQAFFPMLNQNEEGSGRS